MKSKTVSHVYRNSLSQEQIQDIMGDTAVLGLDERYSVVLMMVLMFFSKIVNDAFGMKYIVEFDYREADIMTPEGELVTAVPLSQLSLLMKNPVSEDNLCLYIKLHKGQNVTALALLKEFTENQFRDVYCFPNEENVTALNAMPHSGLRRALKDLVFELGKSLDQQNVIDVTQYAHVNLEQRGLFKMYYYFPNMNVNLTIQSAMIPVIELKSDEPFERETALMN